MLKDFGQYPETISFGLDMREVIASTMLLVVKRPWNISARQFGTPFQGFPNCQLANEVDPAILTSVRL